MIKNLFTAFLPIAILFIFFSCHTVFGEMKSVEKIILFKKEINYDVILQYNGKVLEKYKNFPAVRVSIPERNLNSLGNDLTIKAIETEKKVEVTGQMQGWGVSAIHAQKAWQSQYTGKNVKVAIIDTGIFPHKDLSIAGGKSFVSYTKSYSDDFGHGTHIAGIIGAKNNDFGVVGVAPDVKLYAVKVLNNKGTGFLSDIIAGIDWSISNKMDIINLSLGSIDNSPILEEAVQRARSAGIIVVAAAGNDGNEAGTGDNITYPARYPSVISVAAADNQNHRASFSSTGGKIDFIAPGVNILSTVLNNQYGTYQGTSMATAFVTGTLALLKDMYPGMSNDGLIEQLKRKAIDLGAPGHDSFYGYGLIQLTQSPERIGGADRFEVAVNVSKKGWLTSDTVFICNYNAFADALSTTPLAYKYNAPILLTGHQALNPLTKQEMVRLGTKKAIVIGGSGSVSESVGKEIQSMGISVRRISGNNRFDVSKNIANEMGTFRSAIVANGFNFSDALSIASYAAQQGIPILLTSSKELTSQTGSILKNKGVLKTIVAGGEASVGTEVYKKLPAPVRIGGQDRYDVSANILKMFYPKTQNLYIANGLTFPDALTGSVLIAKENSTILLTRKDKLPDIVLNAIKSRSAAQRYTLLGGVGSVGNNVFSSLAK